MTQWFRQEARRQGFLCKRKLEKVLLREVGKRQKLGMMVLPLKDKMFLSVCVNDIKMVGRKESLDPMWAKFPTPRVDQEFSDQPLQLGVALPLPWTKKTDFFLKTYNVKCERNCQHVHTSEQSEFFVVEL